MFRDIEAFPRWWPTVYLAAHRLTEGAGDGVGRRVAMHTRGRLPYTLRWICTLTAPIDERGFAITAEGDLEGTGDWSFQEIGNQVRVTFEWRVRAAKPLLRRFRWLFRPVFAANHRWAMARGRESIQRELMRRRGLHAA